jgi:uncharacterized protein
MAVHIIIDGYNLIRQSHRFRILDQRELQLGREALIETLIRYKQQKSSHKITIVFDGANAPDDIFQPIRTPGIEITYSRRGESADAVIKRLAEKGREKALIVSSDTEIVHYASSKGAATISSPEFENKIAEALYDGHDVTDSKDENGWVPTTRKKGPHRKLPKKERQNIKKISKL